MAANMMEILKQMNRSISIIDGKLSELDKKMDQQQIITKSLAQQVKNSNTLLFGNDEASIHFQNNTTTSTDKSHLVDEKEKADLDNQPEEYTENIETKRLQDPPKISSNCICQTEAYRQDDDNKDTQNIVLQSISNELIEIKDYLRNFEAKITDGKASLDQDRYFNADQISKLSEELKRNCDEIKKIIRDSGVSKKTIVKVVSSDKRDTVQISPTYFNEEQISKLNEELKRIAELYRSTNIPVIEVVPGCEHPIMEQLRKGLKYKKYYNDACFKIKLGVNGYKRSKVQELLNDNPDLMLSEVVRELFISGGQKSGDLFGYKLDSPIPYDP